VTLRGLEVIHGKIAGGSRIVLRDVLDVLQDAVGQRAQRLLGFVPAVDSVEGLHCQATWQRGVGTTPLHVGGRLAAAV
jgi:hypothetical protein